MSEIIGSGAEAVIMKEADSVVKHRVEKGYRHPEIDKSLRKFRTRREAKVISKLNEIDFPAPKLKQMDDSEMKIDMDFIDGKKVRDVLHENPAELSREIGNKIGILHNNDIIHHDLTTSNMILKDEIHFIDFGLSFFSQKVEDKAVDLHLLDRAMESKHPELYPACFKSAVEGYKKACTNSEEVLQRLERVRNRGRNKGK